MTRFRFLLVAIISFMVLDGCSTTAKFTPTGTSYQRSRRTPGQIELFLDPQAPSRPYVIVGIVATRNLNSGSADVDMYGESLDAMRKSASEMGLDGIMHINCSPIGAVADGMCTGKGFVYQK